MDIEQKLKKFQKAYLETEPSKKFLESGLQDLQEKINHLEQKRLQLRFLYTRPVAFAAILIFILASSIGLVSASTSSLPGEPLYPLKRLSEDTIILTTGNNLVKVDNRAREIIKLNEEKKDNSKLQRAVEDYKAAVNQATSAGRNKEELEEALEQNEAEFHQSQGTSSNEYIKEAIETSRKGRQGDDEQREGESGEEAKEEEEDRSGSNFGKN